MVEPKFNICRHCGNIVNRVKDAGVPIVCCGQPMKELKANTTDAAGEKHLPVITEKDGDKITVRVGDVDHPMLEEHHIQWIYLQTKKGFQLKYLQPETEPVATFVVENDELVAVYEYCNLHGLWKIDA